MIAGAMGDHLLFERFLSGSVHLGAAEISDDDPLMLSALAEAKRTWSDFLWLYPEHPQDTIVKYRVRTKEGDVENVWGDLLDLQSDEATVYLRTPPVGDVDIPDRRMVIPVTDIVDWQIEFQDGSLRGGFTQQAMFRILEREQGGFLGSSRNSLLGIGRWGSRSADFVLNAVFSRGRWLR